jgi:hypothetical protein
MKKKLLGLAIVLAIVAAMIVPMAVSAAAQPSFASFNGVNGWYTVTNSSGFYCAGSPLTEGTSSASLVGGNVNLVSGASTSDEAGIALWVDGSLTIGQLSSITIHGTTPYAVNLWLDTGNDGQFFGFTGSMLTSVNGDTYANWGNSDGSGNLSITGSSVMGYDLGGAPFIPTGTTLAQLAAGDVSGIPSTTKVAIWVGNGDLANGETTSITSIVVNGGATVVPVSNSSSVVNGTFVGPSASINAPSAIGFGTFVPGWNYAGPSTTAGSVTVGGSAGAVPWTVTALGNGWMTDGANQLSNPLLIGNSGTGGPWCIANGGAASIDGTPYPTATPSTLTYTGTVSSSNLAFAAAQYISASDASLPAGVYSDTITFTLSITP